MEVRKRREYFWKPILIIMKRRERKDSKQGRRFLDIEVQYQAERELQLEECTLGECLDDDPNLLKTVSRRRRYELKLKMR